MEKRCKEGWMAACAHYSAMIKDGMSPEEAIAATRDAAGKVGEQPGKATRRKAFDWETHIKGHHPTLEAAIPSLQDYTKYRAESSLKRWTKRTWVSFLRKWDAWGPWALQKSLERTVANGWQGVFEPKRTAPPSKPQPREPKRSPHVL